LTGVAKRGTYSPAYRGNLFLSSLSNAWLELVVLRFFQFAVLAAVFGSLANDLRAQPAVRFPRTSGGTAAAGVYPPSGAPVGSPVLPPSAGAPTSTLGAPTFDPYGNSGAAAYAPSLGGSMSGYGPVPPGVGGMTTPPAVSVPPGTPALGTPLSGAGTAPGVAPYGATGVYPPGGVPGGVGPPAGLGGPTSPPALFPNGLNTTTWGTSPALRFITPRVRYTSVDGGDSADNLGINDFDFSAALAFPNFMYSTQPLYVVPSFSLHLWSGPRPPVGELPANAYSGFLDFGWGTDPSRPLSGEVGLRVGAFSGFNTFNKYSWRIMGQGLFRAQMTPTLAFRGGVIYLNRNKIKLLPAIGLLWIPNSQTRFDIFFPRPKLSQRLTTLGNRDVWWYVGGEYGGGAWTVETTKGMTERTDINDIRIMLGFEWGQPALLQQGRRTGFLEVGWVMDREIVYVETPGITPSLSNALMLRAGLNY